MRIITSFVISGLLLLTQSLDADERGGGVGFPVPTLRSSSPAVPQRAAPAPQGNRAPTAPRRGVNMQPGNVAQRSIINAGQAANAGRVRRSQNQNQSDSRNPVIAAPRQDRHERHDRDWWRQHFRTIVFVLGGYYFGDGGYWYPALGYDPNSSYSADDPIYAYDNLLPDQVITNVQTQLQQAGYYVGPINGSMDSATRAALANYQRDYGLAVTATVDQPTVESLGLAQ